MTRKAGHSEDVALKRVALKESTNTLLEVSWREFGRDQMVKALSKSRFTGA